MRIFLLLGLICLYLQANGHILVYHRFNDLRYPSTDTSSKELVKQFEYLKDNHYKVVKLSAIYEKIKNKQDVPDSWVALTIDDNFKSFYSNGLKIFRKYHYPFTLYVYVESAQRYFGDYMTWKQIKETSKYGDIALHSYAHPRLTLLSSKKIYNDTKKSYGLFVKNLGFKPKSYAYPYGEYDNRVRNILEKFNFNMIVNQSNGSVNKNSDLHCLNRIAMVGKVNIKQKLRYTSLRAKWTYPKVFPKNRMLKEIKLKVFTKQKNLKLYVTGYPWRDIKAKNGIIDLKLNLALKHSKTRIIIGTSYYNIADKIIIKDK